MRGTRTRQSTFTRTGFPTPRSRTNDRSVSHLQGHTLAAAALAAVAPWTIRDTHSTLTPTMVARNARTCMRIPSHHLIPPLISLPPEAPPATRHRQRSGSSLQHAECMQSGRRFGERADSLRPLGTSVFRDLECGTTGPIQVPEVRVRGDGRCPERTLLALTEVVRRI